MVTITITIDKVNDPRLPDTGHQALDINVSVAPKATDPEFGKLVTNREAEVAADMMRALKSIVDENDEVNDSFYRMVMTHQLLSTIMPTSQKVKVMGAMTKFYQALNFSPAAFNENGELSPTSSEALVKQMQHLSREAGFYHKIDWAVPRGTKTAEGECNCPACQVKRELRAFQVSGLVTQMED